MKQKKYIVKDWNGKTRLYVEKFDGIINGGLEICPNYHAALDMSAKTGSDVLELKEDGTVELTFSQKWSTDEYKNSQCPF